MKAGVIAGICIIIALILALALIMYFRWRMAQQAKRYRENFAARVAEPITLRASVNMVTPSALASEFAKIDNGLHDGGDGYISKEELLAFMNSGKAGHMNEKDFNALFAALDVDNNGKVDFVEFCSFLAVCGEEFEPAKRHALEAQKSKSMEFISRRISAISSRHLPMADLEDVTKDDAEDDAGGSEGKEEHGA